MRQARRKQRYLTPTYICIYMFVHTYKHTINKEEIAITVTLLNFAISRKSVLEFLAALLC